MTAKQRGPDKAFIVSFIAMGVALVIAVIGFFFEVAAITYLGMAAFFLGLIVNMAVIITRLMQK